MSPIKRIVVLGDGGWGTTLAILLERKGYLVTLWSAFAAYAKLLDRKRTNQVFLKGVKIPRGIRITADTACLKGADLVVVAVPSAYLRRVLKKTARSYSPSIPVVSVVKGIENSTLMRMSEVVREEWQAQRLAVLSGPTIAQEVAHRVPTAAVVSSTDNEWMLEAQDIFMTPGFRVYANPDVVGVELAGSLKNIIAIACGISDGLGFGTNTKAAILSRGLVEMARLGEAMGGRKETFSGIAGLGDLVTTCFNELSRNHYVGFEIGRGRAVKKVLGPMKMVAEGVPTAKSAWRLGRKYGVDMPITHEVYQVLFNNKTPRVAVDHLLARAKKVE
jgi:glycerol-3-phosphate dehydrogenase (NAD(P)+)